MQTIFSKLTDKEARAEMKQFLIIGYVAAAIAFLFFGLMALVSLACGLRVMIRGNRKPHRTNKDLSPYRSLGLILVIISLALGLLLLVDNQ